MGGCNPLLAVVKIQIYSRDTGNALRDLSWTEGGSH